MQCAGRLSISPSTCLWDRVIVVFVQENVLMSMYIHGKSEETY